MSDQSNSLIVAHFCWATWAIRSHRSFLVSNQSDSLSLLIKKREWENWSFLYKKNLQKFTKKYHFSQICLSESLVFCEGKSERVNKRFTQKNEWYAHLLIYDEQPVKIVHSRSFVMSNLSNSLTVALLTWATWAICSQMLICPEQSEWIAHSRSFDLSDLNKWANER